MGFHHPQPHNAPTTNGKMDVCFCFHFLSAYIDYTIFGFHFDIFIYAYMGRWMFLMKKYFWFSEITLKLENWETQGQVQWLMSGIPGTWEAEIG
jgi:hypothetical protein